MRKHKLTDGAISRVQQDLLFHNWSELDDQNMDVNQAYSIFTSVIETSLDRHAPVKNVRLKQDEKFQVPWLTVGILKCNQKCRKLCNRAKETGNVSDHNKYKLYCNTLN